MKKMYSRPQIKVCFTISEDLMDQINVSVNTDNPQRPEDALADENNLWEDESTSGAITQTSVWDVE